jgi:hypothetical protein
MKNIKLKYITVLIIISTLLLSCKWSYVIKECEVTTYAPELRSLKINESDTVEICSANPRNRTGILLKKNEVYSFAVFPATQRWKDGWLKPFTADGRISPHFTFAHLFKRKIGAKWFSLIGSINDKRSTYF